MQQRMMVFGLVLVGACKTTPATESPATPVAQQGPEAEPESGATAAEDPPPESTGDEGNGYCCEKFDCKQGLCTGSGSCVPTDNSAPEKNACAGKGNTHVTCTGETFASDRVENCTAS